MRTRRSYIRFIPYGRSWYYPTIILDSVASLPLYWIGKRLIYAGDDIDPRWDPNSYILEADIPFPYIILTPHSLPSSYVPGRIIIYVDKFGYIQNLRYG
ncbi:MAG: hypothetical protein QW303_00020 [Nitrososphaerota archaeon]